MDAEDTTADAEGTKDGQQEGPVDRAVWPERHRTATRRLSSAPDRRAAGAAAAARPPPPPWARWAGTWRGRRHPAAPHPCESGPLSHRIESAMAGQWLGGATSVRAGKCQNASRPRNIRPPGKAAAWPRLTRRGRAGRSGPASTTISPELRTSSSWGVAPASAARARQPLSGASPVSPNGCKSIARVLPHQCESS